MRTRIILTALLLFVFVGLADAQDGEIPDPAQIYRYIKFTSDARAGDVRWVEIWETQNNAQSDRQWVMIDLQGTSDGIDSSCYHAVALGNGSPVYFVDGELIPVDSAETLFTEIQNRRLVDQSLFYVTDYLESFDEINIIGEELIAGIPSEKRELVDLDAANLFLVKPPATSTATLWTAIDGGYVTRYEFTADGSTGDVSHGYRLQPGGVIEAPNQVNMQCFDAGFPLADGLVPLVTGNITYSSFQSNSTIDQLKLFYDETLLPEWESEGNSPRGGRIYSRTLENDSVCRLGLEFQSNPNGGTVMTARVIPELVTEEAFTDITDDFSTLSVIQSVANFSFSIPGTVQIALDEVAADLETDGWLRRPELTDIREDSALVTLTKDGVDMHIIIDAVGANAVIQIQQREPVCGPTFVVPQHE